MATEHCPECGEPIARRAKSCACGWTSEPKGKPDTSASYNRCSWQFASDRCAYVARVFAGPSHKGNGLCWDHHICDDATRGREIVAESLRKVPLDFDYSSEHLVKLSREAYFAQTEQRK